MSPSCIAHDGVLEVGPHALRVGLDELHVLLGHRAQLGSGARGHLGADGVLQVGVEPLVVEGPVDHHPVGAALLGDGGNHGQLLARAAHGPRRRRLAARRNAG